MIDIVPNWHPFWVHFPLGLLLVALPLYLFASLFPRHALAATATTVARWNLWLGSLLLLPTLWTGYLAYNSVAHDAAGHAAMERHLTAAWLTLLLFAVAAVLAWFERGRAAGASALLILLLICGGTALAITGYLGAENVYRHGIGVERLPDPGDHHHGDEHAHDHDQGAADSRDHEAPGEAHADDVHEHDRHGHGHH